MEDWRDIDKRERRKEYWAFFIMCFVFIILVKCVFNIL